MKIFKVELTDPDYDDFIGAVMVAESEDVIREMEDEFHKGYLPWDEMSRDKLHIVGKSFKMNSYQTFKDVEEIGEYTGKPLPAGKRVGIVFANTMKR